MKIAALTDIGSCRQENQDNYCARQLVDGTGWGLVCDGMGGANGGNVATTRETVTYMLTQLAEGNYAPAATEEPAA